MLSGTAGLPLTQMSWAFPVRRLFGQLGSRPLPRRDEAVAATVAQLRPRWRIRWGPWMFATSLASGSSWSGHTIHSQAAWQVRQSHSFDGDCGLYPAPLTWPAFNSHLPSELMPNFPPGVGYAWDHCCLLSSPQDNNLEQCYIE